MLSDLTCLNVGDPAEMTLARLKSSTELQRRPASTSRGTKAPALTVSRPELLAGGSDRRFRALVHGLFSFLARHEQIRDGHARHIGLAGIEYTVLISIAHLAQDGDVGVSAVAAHLRVTGAFITTIVQRLQALDLVGKEVDPKDRRRVALSITAEGRARLERLAPMQRQVNDVEFGCLSRPEFESLLDIVERLIASGDQALALQHYLAKK